MARRGGLPVAKTTSTRVSSMWSSWVESNLKNNETKNETKKTREKTVGTQKMDGKKLNLLKLKVEIVSQNDRKIQKVKLNFMTSIRRISVHSSHVHLFYPKGLESAGL